LLGTEPKGYHGASLSYVPSCDRRLGSTSQLLSLETYAPERASLCM